MHGGGGGEKIITVNRIFEDINDVMGKFDHSNLSHF